MKSSSESVGSYSYLSIHRFFLFVFQLFFFAFFSLKIWLQESLGYPVAMEMPGNSKIAFFPPLTHNQAFLPQSRKKYIQHRVAKTAPCWAGVCCSGRSKQGYNKTAALGHSLQLFSFIETLDDQEPGSQPRRCWLYSGSDSLCDLDQLVNHLKPCSVTLLSIQYLLTMLSLLGGRHNILWQIKTINQINK